DAMEPRRPAVARAFHQEELFLLPRHIELPKTVWHRLSLPRRPREARPSAPMAEHVPLGQPAVHRLIGDEEAATLLPHSARAEVLRGEALLLRNLLHREVPEQEVPRRELESGQNVLRLAPLEAVEDDLAEVAVSPRELACPGILMPVRRAEPLPLAV